MHGSLRRELTPEDVELREKMARLESRGSFWAYRQYINYPHMIVGWWQREVALELHRFWDEYRAGLRPKYLLQSPPQHGKSVQVVDFLSWIIGQDHRLKIIFSSFSDRLGVRANLRLRRIFNNPRFGGVFGSMYEGGLQNTKLIEFGPSNDDGYFRNTTVGGSITGEGLDIGIIDDPIKGRAEASSLVIRDKAWNWLTDDFLPRFADKAGLLMIMTRWHLDDPAGRMMEQYPGILFFRYPAPTEKDEKHRSVADRPFVWREGTPLFPELKSHEFLDKQRSVMTLAGWQSVYQQAPIIVGGDMFPVEKAVVVREQPAAGQVASVARYWD